MPPENRVKHPILVPEKRFLHHSETELRVAKRADGKPIIEGYAAKFGKLSQDLGGFREKIAPGAFKNALASSDVRGLKNHDPGQLLGRTKSGTMRLSTDSVGLRFEIDVADTQTGRDTVTDIERGDLDGCSFSFIAANPGGDQWDGDWDDDDPPTRTLLDIRDLFDVGPVTYPAYLDTEVNCRSFDHFKESRQLVRQQASEKREKQAIRLLKLRLGIV